MPLGKTPESLVAVLDDILSKPATSELAILEQLVSVKNPELLDLVPDKISQVVLGLARTNAPPTAETLFTFAQVTLVRGLQALEGLGLNVVVAPTSRD